MNGTKSVVWFSNKFLNFPQGSDAWINTDLVKMEGHA